MGGWCLRICVLFREISGEKQVSAPVFGCRFHWHSGIDEWHWEHGLLWSQFQEMAKQSWESSGGERGGVDLFTE